VYDDYSGTYLGALHQTMSGCANSSKNGTVESYATLVVAQTGLSATVTLLIEGFGSCTITGTLTQDGQFGTLAGTAACGGAPGPVTLSPIVVGLDSIVARYNGGDN